MVGSCAKQYKAQVLSNSGDSFFSQPKLVGKITFLQKSRSLLVLARVVSFGTLAGLWVGRRGLYRGRWRTRSLKTFDGNGGRRTRTARERWTRRRSSCSCSRLEIDARCPLAFNFGVALLRFLGLVRMEVSSDHVFVCVVFIVMFLFCVFRAGGGGGIYIYVCVYAEELRP